MTVSRTRGRQIVMTDEAVNAFLAVEWSGVLGTIGPDGAPHLATVSFGLVDGSVVFTSYGKAQKIVNLGEIRGPRS